MLLGEILVKNNFCKEEDIKQALEIQSQYGGRIGVILLNTGVIVENQILRALSEQLNIKLLSDVKDLEITPVTMEGVSLSFMFENEIYPVKNMKDKIIMATNDPLKMDIFSLLEKLTSKTIVPVLATEDELREIKILFKEGLIEESSSSDIDFDDEIERLKELASEAPVIKLVNNLISKAVQIKASDIHFESFKSGMKVRFRIDGVLRTVEYVPLNLRLAVIARLTLLSKMNIAEHRLPQDGRISVKATGKEIDIRTSSVPTSFGGSFVLRLLNKEDIRYSLESLGFYPDHFKLIKEIISKPNGIFLTTGPTGSGKTTSLYSMLNELNSDNVKIVTVEDPVEYELSGINQIQVKPDIGYKFANALRSILRQDPDILMVGEIRDLETANISIQASFTGHLVLSTLHTNSALKSITRLLEMGVPYFLLKSSVIGLMAQRLVRKLCPYCSQKIELSKNVVKMYDLENLISIYKPDKVEPYKAVGCKKCGYTGYAGRIPIAEVLPFGKDIQSEFDNNSNFEDINKYGYRTLRQDGLLKFLTKITSLEEILRVT